MYVELISYDDAVLADIHDGCYFSGWFIWQHFMIQTWLEMHCVRIIR